jgi:hypothetical protein
MRVHSFENEQAADGGDGDGVALYLETIALLQEEVARLEQELRSRDCGRCETPSYAPVCGEDGIEPAAAPGDVAAAQAEAQELRAELSRREETIVLLLDQLRLVEEAHAATSAEWEQLAAWVGELEERVEGQDGTALRELQDRFAAQERHSDALRMRMEQERRAWEVRMKAYEGEIARLREALESSASSAPAAADPDRAAPGAGAQAEAIEALQSENLGLRSALEELRREGGQAERSETLDVRLAETLAERDTLRSQVARLRDEMARERLEHQAALAELQSRLTRASLARPEDPPRAAGAPANGHARALDADLRIRELRHHLLEIHQREEEER